MPTTHFQARDLRDHGLDRNRRRDGRHQYRQFRKHGRKRQNRTIIFNFGYTAPVVTYRRTRHFVRRPLPTYVIRDRLHRSRYSRLGPIYLERGRYHVRARNGRGVRVKLVIHAASGAIVQRFYLR